MIMKIMNIIRILIITIIIIAIIKMIIIIIIVIIIIMIIVHNDNNKKIITNKGFDINKDNEGNNINVVKNEVIEERKNEYEMSFSELVDLYKKKYQKPFFYNRELKTYLQKSINNESITNIISNLDKVKDYLENEIRLIPEKKDLNEQQNKFENLQITIKNVKSEIDKINSKIDEALISPADNSVIKQQIKEQIEVLNKQRETQELELKKYDDEFNELLEVIETEILNEEQKKK